MSTMSVCVGNYGWYNEGELRDAWIDLPVEPSEIGAWLVRHGLYDRLHEEIYISDYDGVPLGCGYGNIFSECTMLEHLNVLAQLVEDHPDEAGAVERFIDISGEEPESLLGLCNWVLQADELPVYGYDVPEWCEGDSPEAKFGYALAQYAEWWDALGAHGVQDYFDLEAFGRARSADCALGDEGYVDQAQDCPSEDLYSWDEIERMMPWRATPPLSPGTVAGDGAHECA